MPFNSFLARLHPAVRLWFERRFPHGPTAPQAEGWPVIASGAHTLIAAPTGTGKTLTGFLVAIDQLYRDHQEKGSESGTALVYVSPLKALTVDIHKNLEVPLAEIAEVARELGFNPPEIRLFVRSGDTPQRERARMLKSAPHMVITTPESLYLLVTSEQSRKLLSQVKTVIIDEIHALARDKRGSHLALTLERLSALTGEEPQRIGLSATQKPLEGILDLLVGTHERKSRSQIVDTGHRRELDLSIELPDSELEAVISHEQMAEVLDKIATEVKSRRTTLIFVNTRRLSERLAHLLSERLGGDRVTAHHGSLSKERRLAIEDKLRAGELSALVATASLELGIDVGPVELVCQIGSPRSIATFLQRVGRSGHSRFATPVGKIYPLTRDELVESVALLSAIQAGRLDTIVMPKAPLDILAQQIVAECAAQDWKEAELFELVRRAGPFRELSAQAYESVLELVSEGVLTGRGTRGDYIKRDRIEHRLTSRRSARLVAITSGGAIPDNADYRVVADPDDTFVGTINEDFAIESMAGDVFLLGSTSWRIRRVEQGVVRVVDAQGASPTVPFWLGEAPARTAELSTEVSDLRSWVDRELSQARTSQAAWENAAAAWGTNPHVARSVLEYLSRARESLGVLPSQTDIVFERFFDDTGGTQLVVHAPFGGRINRALGLLLRKRFCRSFDFELQAAASDDSILLSLGPQHSFKLDELTDYLKPTGVEEALKHAVLVTPIFAARWRHNLNRFLLVQRFRKGKKNPPQLQRMEADDLMAAIFPSLAACQDNAQGPRVIPDHPVVNQTLHDCLTEALDVEGLLQVLGAIQEGRVRVHFRETTEPSLLCHEILNSRPYTFLDDAPLEERRARAVQLRRGLPLEARDLSSLDRDAIDRVRAEVLPDPRDADELHDLLLNTVLLQKRADLEPWFAELFSRDRASEVRLGAGTELFWCARELAPQVQALFPRARLVPEAPPSLSRASDEDAQAGSDLGAHAPRNLPEAKLLLGHLEITGPVGLKQLPSPLSSLGDALPVAVAALEHQGSLLRGYFDPRIEGEQIASRRVLARIHAYTRDRKRREIEPVTAQDYLRFLFEWHHIDQPESGADLVSVIAKLQGFESSVAAWEPWLLGKRISGYHSAMLDRATLSGEVVWGRPSQRRLEPIRGSSLSRATPISLILRDDLDWLVRATRYKGALELALSGDLSRVIACLEKRGALFFDELLHESGLVPAQLQDALWDGVAKGLVSADGFAPLRLLSSEHQRAGRPVPNRSFGLRRGAQGVVRRQGRWSLFAPSWEQTGGVASAEADDLLAEAVAEQLLARYGVVFRDLLLREAFTVPWRNLAWAFRRLEARGLIHGGRFVSGFTGEQYALPEAVALLREVRRTERTGKVVRISSCDPLNLVGIVTPGPRVAPSRQRVITYRDGLPIDLEGSAPLPNASRWKSSDAHAVAFGAPGTHAPSEDHDLSSEPFQPNSARHPDRATRLGRGRMGSLATKRSR